MQSSPYQEEIRSWVFSFLFCAESAGTVLGNACVPMWNSLFHLCAPPGLMNAKPHQLPELGDLGPVLWLAVIRLEWWVCAKAPFKERLESWGYCWSKPGGGVCSPAISSSWEDAGQLSHVGRLEGSTSGISWESVHQISSREKLRWAFLLAFFFSEPEYISRVYSHTYLKTASLIARVLWDSWMQVLLALRAGWFDGLSLRW